MFNYENLVFSGGGVHGIAYLGALEYFYKMNLISSIKRVAGTSAGAITACLTCFNLPFQELSDALSSLDYRQIPAKDDLPESSRDFPAAIKEQVNKIFDNADCVLRLINKYGWYSSSYFYEWIKEQIALQFDATKKAPPYTFADFQNNSIHKNQRPFKDLYVIGTNLPKCKSIVFSFDTTPNLEVAQAVRISMSVPLLFESITCSCENLPDEPPYVYIDGGMLYNYPINLFDTISPIDKTIGFYFKCTSKPSTIKNLVEFISATLSCTGSVQQELFTSNPENIKRSICIQTSDIPSLNFNISTGDNTFNFLYEQGYRSTELYFSLLKNN